MPSLADLLVRLEESKRQFGKGHGAETARLMGVIERQRFRDAESLIRFHEALLFIRAYPQTPATFSRAGHILSTFIKKVRQLAGSGADLIAFDYIEYSGIAGTTISGTFSYDIDRWLVERYPSTVEVDWDRCERGRLSRALPRFLPLLYEDSLVEANVPYIEWLHSASGEKTGDLSWLIERFSRSKLEGRETADLFDSLELRVRWELGDSRASRTQNFLPPKKPFCHAGPLIARREVSLDSEFEAEAIELQKLSRAEGKEKQDMLRETTTVRYRELYGITHGDPESVLRADVGRGVEIFLWGLPAARRLPLRAYHAGFTLKNGVPINYIEGITICERMEVGFNTFYTFREGESAWVYAKVLRLLHQLVGVTCISIDPYQLGFNNEEAIESGAFWFYRKLGFRPARPELARLMATEEKKISTNPKYRTPARVLRRLSHGNMIYEAPGSPRGEWDRFAIRNVGLFVQRRLWREFDGDVEKIRKASTQYVERCLGLDDRPRTEVERRALEDIALVLATIPNLASWTPAEKHQAIDIIEAKMAPREAAYARLLQAHKKLRASIISLGEAPQID